MADCKSVTMPTEIGLKLSACEDSKPVYSTLYSQLLVSLFYLTTIRLDLSYAGGNVLQFKPSFKDVH
jgi:hypothetical protein